MSVDQILDIIKAIVLFLLPFATFLALARIVAIFRRPDYGATIEMPEFAVITPL